MRIPSFQSGLEATMEHKVPRLKHSALLTVTNELIDGIGWSAARFSSLSSFSFSTLTLGSLMQSSLIH